MDSDTKKIIFCIGIVIGLCILYGISIDYQKADCLAAGGKWVSGTIGGNYSAFCIPNF